MEDVPPTPVPTPDPDPAPVEPQAPPAAAAPSEGGAPPKPPTPAKPAKPVKQESWWSTVRFMLYLFLGAVLLRTFVIAPFSIPSASMLPNLLVGDYLFVAK